MNRQLVRLLAASSRNLADATHYGRLREGLYSRLKTFTVEQPPLRGRLEDIPALSEMFIKQSAGTNAAAAVRGIDNECLEILCSYRWLGNVLQLRNVLERATIVARRPLLTAAALPAEIRRAGRNGANFELRMGDSVDEVEREFILKTLDFTHGNKVRAADILGVSLKTLYNRLERYQEKNAIWRVNPPAITIVNFEITRRTSYTAGSQLWPHDSRPRSRATRLAAKGESGRLPISQHFGFVRIVLFRSSLVVGVGSRFEFMRTLLLDSSIAASPADGAIRSSSWMLGITQCPPMKPGK